ncbi:MAG: phosphate signaling complex protein PhoU [Magnetovibrio sp.]|nr:phosphate signaling complex protein PhoU [Magnetovibrio sp.]
MESEHIVKSFDDDLSRLDAIIAEMGGLVERQLASVMTALVTRDIVMAQQVIDDDKRVDELESEIDHLTMTVLALRQPMADDLRAVIVVLKMAANLERIGDYAKNIAKRIFILAEMETVGNTAESVQRMAGLVQAMIKNVLDAYGTLDINKADAVRLRDEEVDRIHTSLFRELLTYMMEDPHRITACTHLLFVSKNIERIGDHVTSIAEYIHFLVSGEMPEDERPKCDMSSQTSVE